MIHTITLRGYALPWNESILLTCGTYERFAPTAFDDILSRRTPIDIRFGGHERNDPLLASTRDGSARLFVDDYGLGFEARIDTRANWGKVRAITQRDNPFDRCSIGGLIVISSDQDKHLGTRRETIKRATIDHIAIVDHSAAYKETAVWPADHDLEMAPWRIQRMAARWSSGNADWQRRSKLIASAESGTQLARVQAIWREIELANRGRVSIR
jgi:phage head maturation protease